MESSSSFQQHWVTDDWSGSLWAVWRRATGDFEGHNEPGPPTSSGTGGADDTPLTIYEQQEQGRGGGGEGGKEKPTKCSHCSEQVRLVRKMPSWPKSWANFSLF